MEPLIAGYPPPPANLSNIDTMYTQIRIHTDGATSHDSNHSRVTDSYVYCNRIFESMCVFFNYDRVKSED